MYVPAVCLKKKKKTLCGNDKALFHVEVSDSKSTHWISPDGNLAQEPHCQFILTQEFLKYTKIDALIFWQVEITVQLNLFYIY